MKIIGIKKCQGKITKKFNFSLKQVFLFSTDINKAFCLNNKGTSNN